MNSHLNARLRWLAVACVLAACSPEGDGLLDAPNSDAAATSDAERDATTPDVTSNSDVGVPDASPDAAAGDAGTFDIEEFSDIVWTWTQTSPTCAYSNNGLPWNWQVFGREPAQDGRYPVFLYLHGTGDVADGEAQISIIESMASRGFVAASVAYDSLSGIGQVIDDPAQTCPILDSKVDCLFGAGSDSAVTKICAREKADCDLGIVVAGHSQGSAIAIRAKDHEPRVQAAWGLSAGIHIDLDAGGLRVTSDATLCGPPAVRALPEDRLLIVNGESEYAYADALQQDMRDLTNMDCPLGTLECLRPDGSGWTFFPDAANEDGRDLSQHCYMANMPAGDCTASTGLNSTWNNGTATYCREPALDWLSQFVAR